MNPSLEPLSPMVKILEPSCNRIFNLGNIVSVCNIIMTQYYITLKVNYCISIVKGLNPGVISKVGRV